MSKYIKFIFLLILTLSLFSCDSNRKKPPTAKNGILDLRGWDFEKEGIIKLDGEWEFYWSNFLTSKDFDTLTKRHFATIPSTWNGYLWDDTPLPKEGFTSYKLKILVNKNLKKFAIYSPAQGIAYKLFLNAQLIGKNGKTGKTKKTSEPQYNPKIIEIDLQKDTNDVVFWVSNFHYWKGGLWHTPDIGFEPQIRDRCETSRSFEYFTAGALVLFTFILFCFYFYRPQEKSYLYFGILCFVGMVRIITTGEILIIKLLPQISWELLIKLELCSFYATAPLLWFYIKTLFPKDVIKKIPDFLLAFSIAIILFTFIFPASIHSHILLYVEFFYVIICLYVIFIFIITIVRKRENSFIFSMGYFMIIFSGITETLYHNNIINLYFPVSVGILFLFFSQALFLSRMFSLALKRVEHYAYDLKKEVELKTKDLRDEKQKSDNLLLNVLPESIANRLKAGETQIADHFDEASVVFIDIVDFTKLSAKSTPQKMVKMLNEIFTIFGKIATKYGLEKIKTIGDCYMAAAGIPIPRSDHAQAIAMMALEVLQTMKDYRSEDNQQIQFRIGLDCGPIVAGVIGEQKFIYDLWGDMVNTASRMETNGVIGKIQCTERFKHTLEHKKIPLPPFSKGESEAGGFKFHERGEIEIKGKGMMRTWLLESNTGEMQ